MSLKTGFAASLPLLFIVTSAATAGVVTFEFNPTTPGSALTDPTSLHLSTTGSSTAGAISGLNVVNAIENGRSIVGVQDNYINLGEYLWTTFSESVSLRALQAVRVKESEHISLFLPNRPLIAGVDYVESALLAGGIRTVTFADGLNTNVLGISTEGADNNGISLDNLTVFRGIGSTAVVPLPAASTAGLSLLALAALRRRRDDAAL